MQKAGGVSMSKLLPLLRAVQSSTPPETLSLSHTQPQSAFCFVLLHKHSHRKGAESLLPSFYLLTFYPPSKAVLGQKESPPPPAYSPFFFTPFSHIHTCTYEHTHPYKLNQPGQQLDMRWQIGVFVFLKGGWGDPMHTYTQTHTHTEPSNPIVGKSHRTADNVQCLQRLRREIWCCLCGR